MTYFIITSVILFVQKISWSWYQCELAVGKVVESWHSVEHFRPPVHFLKPDITLINKSLESIYVGSVGKELRVTQS